MFLTKIIVMISNHKSLGWCNSVPEYKRSALRFDMTHCRSPRSSCQAFAVFNDTRVTYQSEAQSRLPRIFHHSYVLCQFLSIQCTIGHIPSQSQDKLGALHLWPTRQPHPAEMMIYRKENYHWFAYLLRLSSDPSTLRPTLWQNIGISVSCALRNR